MLLLNKIHLQIPIIGRNEVGTMPLDGIFLQARLRHTKAKMSTNGFILFQQTLGERLEYHHTKEVHEIGTN